MKECRNESKHRAAMSAVRTSVEVATVPSTFGSQRKTTRGSEGQQPAEGTTLGTGDGERWSSLVIRSVRCAISNQPA